jgi:hypothetical protein
MARISRNESVANLVGTLLGMGLDGIGTGSTTAPNWQKNWVQTPIKKRGTTLSQRRRDLETQRFRDAENGTPRLVGPPRAVPQKIPARCVRSSFGVPFSASLHLCALYVKADAVRNWPLTQFLCSRSEPGCIRIDSFRAIRAIRGNAVLPEQSTMSLGSSTADDDDGARHGQCRGRKFDVRSRNRHAACERCWTRYAR